MSKLPNLGKRNIFHGNIERRTRLPSNGVYLCGAVRKNAAFTKFRHFDPGALRERKKKATRGSEGKQIWNPIPQRRVHIISRRCHSCQKLGKTLVIQRSDGRGRRKSGKWNGGQIHWARSSVSEKSALRNNAQVSLALMIFYARDLHELSIKTTSMNGIFTTVSVSKRNVVFIFRHTYEIEILLRFIVIPYLQLIFRVTLLYVK